MSTKIKPSNNPQQWPRKATQSIETRKRDFVVRIADWTRQSPNTGEPAYDVECYIGGVYDFNESQTFTLRNSTKAQAKAKAIAYAQAQIAKHL